MIVTGDMGGGEDGTITKGVASSIDGGGGRGEVRAQGAKGALMVAKGGKISFACDIGAGSSPVRASSDLHNGLNSVPGRLCINMITMGGKTVDAK